MDIAWAIILVVFLLAVIGLVVYLIRLNRLAKYQQSQVDPSKLHKWND